MPIEMVDPAVELKNRAREMNTRGRDAAMDPQELAERKEAARAYSGENEQHFVDYCMDCRKQSVEAMKEIRQVQSDCWNVYQENEPVSYADKEPWMSRILVPKPFSAVQYGASAVKKAFSPNYLSVTHAKHKEVADFWQRIMDWQLNEQHANLILRFTDAVTMALAVGVSMEMIPRFVPGQGLEFQLAEPWKIHRDPDAAPRDPQSGMFWIHEEWLDYYVLLEAQKAGKYTNVARAKMVDQEDPEDPFMTKQAIRARKEQIWEDRSGFRKFILTSEFWGIVLDPKGEMLLPRATYTVAGGRVIQKPEPAPYRSLRWPGISFSPLPDLLSFGGRGLLEGVLTIWEAMNNLLCLHHDYLQWIVNPPVEVCADNLVDPMDVEIPPGKKVLVRDTVSGHAVLRPMDRRSRTTDALSNSQYYDQLFQRGSFVTDAVQGLPGYRQDMTYREAAMNLGQAMGVYGLMGENIENGAILAISAAQEIIEQYAGLADYEECLPDELVAAFGIGPNPEASTGVMGVPHFDGSFRVSGIQALMRENEVLKALKEVVIPLAGDPRFGPYIKPYQTLKAIEERVNLSDEGVFASEEEAAMIDQQQQQMQAEATRSAKNMQDLAEAQAALGVYNEMEAPGVRREAPGEAPGVRREAPGEAPGVRREAPGSAGGE